MSKEESPQPIFITEEEADDLEDRIRKRQTTDKDIELIIGLMAFSRWLQGSLTKAKLSIKLLKKLFGFKNESRPSKPKAGDSSDDNTGEGTNKGNDKTGDSKTGEQNNIQSSQKPNWNSSANHGRTSVNAYTGCELIAVGFENELLKIGRCPECAKSNTVAKIIAVKAKVLIFLESSPLITGKRYALAKARCVICLAYFTAPEPKEIKDQPKYAPSCAVTICIQHYYAGMPFYRLEMLQKLSGIPLADATQYDLVHGFYLSAVQPIVEVMRRQAANGEKFGYDDTALKILEQIKQNKRVAHKKDKKAVHATALLSDYEGHRIYLFDTNTLTAGKQFADTLRHRTIQNNFISMSDASSHNFPNLDDELMICWIISLCLTHARRNFVELFSEGDKEIELILNIIGDVYTNDRYCKDHQLSDDERLAYHQKYSGPPMESLRIWLNNLMLFKKVEPNSPLGGAIIYLLKRWHWLTQFLRISGAPLDNNGTERTIKVLIMYRKNSLFYRTCYGASIGDAMMSLIHTAAQAEVNIFHYLTALAEHTEAVQADPERWLPWYYEVTMSALNEPTPELVNSS